MNIWFTKTKLLKFIEKEHNLIELTLTNIVGAPLLRESGILLNSGAV